MAGDVVNLIMNDHREVERIFDTLRNEPDGRAGLVPVMSTLLTAHSRAEEAEFYPAARPISDNNPARRARPNWTSRQPTPASPVHRR